jgi:hypothetical protein
MSSHWRHHLRTACTVATLAASLALVPALAKAAPATKTPAGTAVTEMRQVGSLPRAQRKEIKRLIAGRRAGAGKVRARAAFTERLWYDNYRVGTSASGIYLQGFTYINVWNPIVKSINGLSSQRVAFRSLVYNPSNGDVLVSDWWKGTTQNFGSYTGWGFSGGSVTNHRTGARMNGDGAMTFQVPGSGWWAALQVEWITSTGQQQRLVGFWLE